MVTHIHKIIIFVNYIGEMFIYDYGRIFSNS